MSAAANPHPFLEELIAWATPEEHKADLLDARAAWFKANGEVFDDERALEQRMAAFLEHYVCDREAPHLEQTPARARYELSLKTEVPERAAGFRSLTATIHSLYEVLKLEPGLVRLSDVFTGITWEISERRNLAGLSKGDVLEARLIDFGGLLHFSGAWTWHPHAASRLIREEARRQVKASPQPEKVRLIEDCAQRALKVERYRQISVEKIYDFAAKRA